ncbi:hypothetical protein N9U65_02350 [Planctomycetaceae bacterium]|nr:hypothetical protein [Planctomycetaceae bacterium]
MAKKREGPVQALTIALIIFVMCTFVLAVTTYVFYAQNEDNKVAKKEADNAANEARQSLATAEQAQKDLLESRIGVNEGDSIDAVDKELASLQDKVKKYGGDGNTTPTYRGIIKTLDKALVNKDSANKTLEANIRDLESDLAASRASLDEKTESHNSAIDEKQKELARVSQESKKWQDDFTERYQASIQETEKERAEKERLIALEDQIKKFILPSLSTESQQKYKAAQGDPASQLQIIAEELNEQIAAIKKKNQVLGYMRIADQRVIDYIHSYIKNSLPEDRVEGFDGTVVVVNELEQTVVIAFPQTYSLRIGTIFSVYNPGEHLPLTSSKKALVEIVSKDDSKRTARGRVLRGSNFDPVLKGDAVATNLWSPLMPLQVVLAGHIQLDQDSATDDEDLKELIENAGGTVTDQVSYMTTFVVDAGMPNQQEQDDEYREQKRQRQAIMDRAKELGIKILNTDRFLEMFGLEENYFDADHLVTPTP